MRRGIGLGVGMVLLLLVATCGRDSAPTAGPGETGSVVVGRDGGRVEFGAVTLDVPAGALAEPTPITVRQLEDAPWAPSARPTTSGRQAPPSRFPPG